MRDTYRDRSLWAVPALGAASVVLLAVICGRALLDAFGVVPLSEFAMNVLQCTVRHDRKQ